MSEVALVLHSFLRMKNSAKQENQTEELTGFTAGDSSISLFRSMKRFDCYESVVSVGRCMKVEGTMKIFKRGFIRNRKMYSAVKFGLKLLSEGKELALAVQISADYFGVKASKVQRHLVLRTDIPVAARRKPWPVCSRCERGGPIVKASFEVRSDKYYLSEGRSHEDIYGRHLNDEDPYLCESCIRCRKLETSRSPILSSGWMEIVEPIDPRRFKPWCGEQKKAS
jgi:hypothetical protein